MSTYRNGDDDLTPEQEKALDMTQETEATELEGAPVEEAPTEAPAEGSAEQEAPKAEAPQTPPQLQDIETAVLLVVNSQGAVLPVVQIDSLDMKRIATPREVYRICQDAADQLSSVSLLGEMTQIYSALAKEQSKLIASNMAQLLIQLQKSASEKSEN